MEEYCNDIHSAYALAQKNSLNQAARELPPTQEEAVRLLNVLKLIRAQTRDFFSSILNNVGVGLFKPSDGRPFNRNLLFNKNYTSPFLKIYSYAWLKEIQRCHLQLWSAADNDPEVKNLYTFVQDFKHEWEDFFQVLADNFPESASDLVSDFEFAGLEMFNEFESSILSANAKTDDYDSYLGTVENYLPEIKKVFFKEFKGKALSQKQSSDSKHPGGNKLRTASDVIKQEFEKDNAREQEQLSRLKESFRHNWMISIDFINTDIKPEGASEFDLLIDYIENEIKSLEDRKIRTPGPLCTWQNVLPVALTFPTDLYGYGVTDENDDDPETFVRDLESGEKVYIHVYYDEHPLEHRVRKVQQLVGTYIENAFKVAKEVKSKSEDIWAEALGYYKRVNHAFRISQNKELIEHMAQRMIDAATRLCIDLELQIPRLIRKRIWPPRRV